MKKVLNALLLLLFSAAPAFAGQQADSGDTAFVIVATALVMMMTPAGLALFYGGMSRYKNLLNTLAMTFVAYSLAFGPSEGKIVGGLDYLFLAGIGPESVSGTIPTLVLWSFR
jgi:Amt family ammonium transporter